MKTITTTENRRQKPKNHYQQPPTLTDWAGKKNKSKMEKKKVCCICGKEFVGWANNPWPIKEDGECCDVCNSTRVIPARIMRMLGS